MPFDLDLEGLPEREALRTLAAGLAMNPRAFRSLTDELLTGGKALAPSYAALVAAEALRAAFKSRFARPTARPDADVLLEIVRDLLNDRHRWRHVAGQFLGEAYAEHVGRPAAAKLFS